MNEQAGKLLDKARRAIHAADVLLAEGDPECAVGRAYYAMFYAAEALLVTQGLRFRKHGSMHAAFGEHFAKRAILDPKYHRWLLDAYDARIVADYGVEAELTAEDAEQILAHAREFVGEANCYLGAAS